MTLWQIYFLFLKFGFLCVGGGNALLPLFVNELVLERKLITMETLGNLTSIAQMTPGPIGINSATYIGYLLQGFPGAVAGTAGLLTPGFLMVLPAVYLLRKYSDSIVLQTIMAALRPAALGLLLAGLVIFSEMSIFDGSIPYLALFSEPFPAIRPGAILIAAIGAWGMLKTKWNFLYFILIGAVLGALLCK